MIAWWDSLSLISQIFACIAIPATVVTLIQTVLMVIGMDSDTGDTSDMPEFDDFSADTDIDADIDLDTDIDADFNDGIFGSEDIEADPDPSGLDDLHIFTVRGIVAFLVVFGWVGYALDAAGIAIWISVLAATVCGFIMMFLLALLMRAVMKLRSDGNLDNRNALGVSGKVYLTVPAMRCGEGKVNVLLQGSYVERDAVTDEAESIPTGAEIVVTGLSGQSTLVVKRK